MQRRQPMLSVIMAVHNGARHLPEALQSILRQSFADFEFIIINDGSTDDSSAILNRFASDDRRIRLVERDNRGLTASLNEGIRLSRANWIARMDADDIAHKRRFQVQLQQLHKQEADIAGSSMRLFGTAIPSRAVYPLDDESCRLRMIFRSPFGHPAVMMKSRLARSLLYDESFPRAQDYELWTRFAMHGAKMANCKQALLAYRRHPNQLSTRDQDAQQRLFELAQERYCDWLGVPASNLALIRRFSGRGATASHSEADSLGDLMAELRGFSGKALAREYSLRLVDVSPAHWRLLQKSVLLSRRVGGIPFPSARLALSCLAGEAVSHRLKSMLR